jgi:hypothetical protein
MDSPTRGTFRNPRYNKPKLYLIWVKVLDGKMKSWRTNDLLKFTDFLDKEWRGWRFFNVYSNQTGTELGRFQNNNRPMSKYI